MKQFFSRTVVVAFAALLMTACLGGGSGADRQTLLSGGSWPGVTVADGTIYMAYQSNVYAIDDTGRRVWSFPQQSERNQTFFASPAVADGFVVVGDYTDTVFAIDAETGLEAWSFTSRDRGRFVAGATIDDNVVYIPDAAGYLYALDLETGEELWYFQAERDIWSTPVVAEGAVYVTSLDRHFYAVDVDSGEQLWKYPAVDTPTDEQDIGAMVSTPAYNDGVLYVSTLDKLFIAIDVETQEVLWTYEGLENWIFSKPLIVDSLLVMGDLEGNVTALDIETGAEEWVFETGGPVVGAPLLAENFEGEAETVIYVASADANVYILNAADGDPTAAPAEVENEFTARFLVLNTGTETRSVPIYATPVIFDDVILFGLHQGNSPLRAYDLDSLLPRWSFTPQE